MVAYANEIDLMSGTPVDYHLIQTGSIHPEAKKLEGCRELSPTCMSYVIVPGCCAATGGFRV